MFRNILVPVDFTNANLSALDVAADISRQADGVVHLLHVVQTIPGLHEDEERTFYGELEASARKRLAGFGKRIAARNARWETRAVLGSRIGEILRMVAEQGIDLIVLSSHRIDLESSESRSSTLSYQVGLLAPCPVLLMK